MQEKIKAKLAECERYIAKIKAQPDGGRSAQNLLREYEREANFLRSLLRNQPGYVAEPNAQDLLTTTKPVDTKWGTESLLLAISDQRTYVYNETFHLTNIGALRLNQISGEVYNIANPARIILTVPSANMAKIKTAIVKRLNSEKQH